MKHRPESIEQLIHGDQSDMYNYRRLRLSKLVVYNNLENDISGKNRRNRDLLDAIHSCHYERVKYEIANGAKVNSVDQKGNAALYVACRKGHRKITELLLREGADPNVLNSLGDAPIHVATLYAYADIHIVQLLLDAGADPNILNSVGYPPIHIAMQYLDDSIHIVQLLLEAGANPYLITRRGKSAFALAENSQNTFLIDLLSNYEDNVKERSAPDKLIQQYIEKHGEVFDFEIDDEKNIRIKKYFHASPRKQIVIPDFVHGFTLNEHPQEPIFSDLSHVESIKLGKNVKDLSYMFYRCGEGRLDLSHWDVSQITHMVGLFSNSRLKKVGDLAKWDVSNIIDISWIFHQSQIMYLGRLDDWNTARVSNFAGAFACSCLSDVGDLSGWDVSSAQDMGWLFAGSQLTHVGDLNTWDVSNVIDMQSLFEYSQLSGIGDISAWQTSSVGIIKNMLYNTQLAPDSCYPIQLEQRLGLPFTIEHYHLKHGRVFDFIIDTDEHIRIQRYYDDETRESVVIPDFVYGFACKESYHYDEKDESFISREPIFPNMTHVREIKLGEGMEDLSYMFYKSGQAELDLGDWDVSTVSNMSHLFEGCLMTDIGDVGAWDISSVTNMNSLFKDSKIRHAGYLNEWEITSWVRDKRGILENSALSSRGDLINEWGDHGDAFPDPRYCIHEETRPSTALITNCPPPSQIIAKRYYQLKVSLGNGAKVDDVACFYSACKEESDELARWLMCKAHFSQIVQVCHDFLDITNPHLRSFLHRIVGDLPHIIPQEEESHLSPQIVPTAQRKKRSDIGQIHSLYPYYRIAIFESSERCHLYLDIPKQKFTLTEHDQHVQVRVSSKGASNPLHNETHQAYRSKVGFYYSNKIAGIKIPTLFDTYQIKISSNEYTVNKVPYYLFKT